LEANYGRQPTGVETLYEEFLEENPEYDETLNEEEALNRMATRENE
jgi:hypothetical protein